MAWFLVESAGTRSHFAKCQLVRRGRKAILARNFMHQHLAAAKKILLDVHEVDPNGDTVAIVYAGGINLGQELLYPYLAMDDTPAPSPWCE